MPETVNLNHDWKENTEKKISVYEEKSKKEKQANENPTVQRT